MKAVGFYSHGGPEALIDVELPLPEPGPEDVIIAMKAIGLNFADIYRRRGEYPIEPPAPYILGMEGAGIVSAIGSRVEAFAIGDRVAFAHVPRANAAFVKAPASKVVSLPEDITFEAASSILLQGMTAHYLTHESYVVKPGETILVHAASGGVGSLLVQLCKEVGARVIGTVSTYSKVELAYGFGADEVIVRSGKKWVREVISSTRGTGVDAAFDAIGSTLNETLSIVRPKGSAIYYGWAGGRPPFIDPNLLMNDSKKLIGGDLWSHLPDRDSLLMRSHFLFERLREGKLRTQISKLYSLNETGAAHKDLESGTTTGKFLLIP